MDPKTTDIGPFDFQPDPRAEGLADLGWDALPHRVDSVNIDTTEEGALVVRRPRRLCRLFGHRFTDWDRIPEAPIVLQRHCKRCAIEQRKGIDR